MNFSQEDYEVLEKFVGLLDTHGIVAVNGRLRALRNVHLSAYRSKYAWSKEDLELLQEQYPVMGARIPKLREKFTASEIISKASRLGLHYSLKNLWTDDQIAILKEKYPKLGSYIPELRAYFSVEQICKKASYFGLHTTNRHSVGWSSKDVKILREKYASYGSDIPELLGKFSTRMINTKANRLGLRRVCD